MADELNPETFRRIENGLNAASANLSVKYTDKSGVEHTEHRKIIVMIRDDGATFIERQVMDANGKPIPAQNFWAGVSAKGLGVGLYNTDGELVGTTPLISDPQAKETAAMAMAEFGKFPANKVLDAREASIADQFGEAMTLSIKEAIAKSEPGR